MRTELDQLRQAGYMFEDPFDVIHMFERKICAYTNAPMCVVVDSDTGMGTLLEDVQKPGLAWKKQLALAQKSHIQ